jgi:hypothetical protein
MPGQTGRPAAIAERAGHAILEIKLRSDAPPWLTAAMRDLLVVTNFSKFRDGLFAVRRAAALAAAMSDVAAA